MAKTEELLNELLKELNTETVNKMSESLDNLSNTMVDQTEEQMATYVEGTKRVIKSTDNNSQAVNKNTSSIDTLSRQVMIQTQDLKQSMGAVERAIKANKVSVDTSKMETSLSVIEKAVKGFKFPTKASEAIPVRMSDGKKFIKGMQSAVQKGTETAMGYYVGGSGGSKAAYVNSNGGTSAGLVDEDKHVQVDIVSTPTSAGLSTFRSLDIDQTEEQIKETEGKLHSISAFNTTDAPLYLKFYNATAANVSVGSTTPVLTFVVPGNADSDGAGFIWNNDIGLAFSTAMTVACTTGVADNDTGAPGVNACIVNIGYS